MRRPVPLILVGLALTAGALLRVGAQDGGPPSRPASSRSPDRGATSYAPVAIEEKFPEIFRRLSAEKPQVMKRAQQELEARYDLSDRPAQGVTMTRGKPVQEGVRAKLPQGTTWQAIAAMTPDEVRKRDLFPRAFLPLPHAKHAEGGMVFPAMHIEQTKQQSARDLSRFDVDFDIPERFLPEFPPPVFLNQRPDLGDVSKGQLITQENFFELFDGIITPKQIEGLRLLVSPFAQRIRLPRGGAPDRRPRCVSRT